MYARIVVPLDGSELAELALRDAETMAGLVNAPIHLVRVIDYGLMAGYGGFGLPLDYQGASVMAATDEADAVNYLHEVSDRFAAKDILVDAETVHGPTARAIVSILKPDDLLVMATHGRGGFSRWLLGSVAEDVLRHSSAPVLLIRSGNVDVTAVSAFDALRAS